MRRRSPSMRTRAAGTLLESALALDLIDEERFRRIVRAEAMLGTGRGPDPSPGPVLRTVSRPLPGGERWQEESVRRVRWRYLSPPGERSRDAGPCPRPGRGGARPAGRGALLTGAPPAYIAPCPTAPPSSRPLNRRGPSCSCCRRPSAARVKTTMSRRLLVDDPEIVISVSATTRPATQGRDRGARLSLRRRRRFRCARRR